MLDFMSMCVLLIALNTSNYKYFKNYLINQTGYFTRKDRIFCTILSLFGPISTVLMFLIRFGVFCMDEIEHRNEILEDYR